MKNAPSRGVFFRLFPLSLAVYVDPPYAHNMVRLLIVCIIILFTAMVQAEIYQWKDDQGNLHFSDSLPDAGHSQHDVQKIEISPIQTVPAFKPPEQGIDTSSEEVVGQVSYQQMHIVQPEHDSAIRNNAGDIVITVALQPPLRLNDSIYLIMDGKIVAQGQQTRFQLTNVDRGTHTIHAEVRNSAGQKRINTHPIDFSVLRASIISRPLP